MTFKARPNRRRPESIWSKLPKPAVVAEACGRTLRRSVPLVVGAAALFAVGGTAWAGYRFVTTSPRFAVTTLEISGNQHLTRDEIFAAAGVQVGDNVFRANLDGVVAELRKNPWVASASARRVLPHTIEISVREHVPAAIVQLGGLYLVDDAGRAFKHLELGAEADNDEGAGLPIVTGLDRAAYVADPAGAAAHVRGALAALARWRAAPDRPSIGEVHLGAHGTLTLVTYEHAISIQLGTLEPGDVDDLQRRMQTFDATWAQLSPSERSRARSIHLDARPDHVTIALQKDP
jgi:cell division protein FtsQ